MRYSSIGQNKLERNDIVAEQEANKEPIEETEKEILKDTDAKESSNESADGQINGSGESSADAGTSDGDENGAGAADANENTPKEKKDRKRKDKKQDALKDKIEELEDRVKRQMAEFDNFRKRTEKEKSAMFETGAKSVIEKILPVVDNFERGLATVPETDKDSAFAQGMEMIYKQLLNELEAIDVKPIEAVGQEFNPEFHNAVMQVASEEYGSGIVAQELQKGYTYRDSVVRHSMVAVTE